MVYGNVADEDIQLNRPPSGRAAQAGTTIWRTRFSSTIRKIGFELNKKRGWDLAATTMQNKTHDNRQMYQPAEYYGIFAGHDQYTKILSRSWI